MFCVTLPCFDYTFGPIWTNLLTQCTQLLVPVFCYFYFSGFPQIKSARKILEKLYKKSAFPKLPEKTKWGQRATTRGPGAPMARPGRTRDVPDSLVAPLV